MSIRLKSKGFDTSMGSYTRSDGSQELDAAVLVLPRIGLGERGFPRVRGTVDAIRRQLSAGGSLLYRYPPGRDGLPGTEGAFLPCSFLLVEALALDDRRREAVDLFTELLDRASPWGLYAEEMDPKTGEHLGNYPQALTHAAVVRGLCEGGISRSPRQAQATRLAIRSKRESPDKD